MVPNEKSISSALVPYPTLAFSVSPIEVQNLKELVLELIKCTDRGAGTRTLVSPPNTSTNSITPTSSSSSSSQMHLKCYNPGECFWIVQAIQQLVPLEPCQIQKTKEVQHLLTDPI